MEPQSLQNPVSRLLFRSKREAHDAQRNGWHRGHSRSVCLIVEGLKELFGE